MIFLIILGAGCSSQGAGSQMTVPTSEIMAETIPVTQAPPASETPPPPTDQQMPSMAPVEGITSTQLNVRAEPSTASEILGILPANTSVQIVGKDPGENWWQILYPEVGEANDRKGWVTAQYVSTVDESQVPVIGSGRSDPANPNAALAALAIIQEQLNVRSGPGTSFDSLGTLNPQDVVVLTGKDSPGAWLQIEYSAGPDGRGWINAAFARADAVEDLPIIADSGQVIGTGTPVDTPLPPTPTVVPAPSDNDSAQDPAVNVTFTADGTHALQFTSEVSSPAGDSDDWIQFTPFTRTAVLELTCSGNGSVTVEALESGQSVPDLGDISCGERRPITMRAGLTYQIHIQANASEQLSYTQFVLKIVSIP